MRRWYSCTSKGLLGKRLGTCRRLSPIDRGRALCGGTRGASHVQAFEDEPADLEMTDAQRKELERLRQLDPDREYSFVAGKLRVEGRFEAPKHKRPRRKLE